MVSRVSTASWGAFYILGITCLGVIFFQVNGFDMSVMKFRRDICQMRERLIHGGKLKHDMWWMLVQ